MKRWTAMLGAILLCLALLAACGGGSGADDSWTKVEENGKFILGMDSHFPPMGFEENGELTGFDVDLARAVAAKLGVEVELKTIDWKMKEVELQSRTVDVLWNGYTATPERQEINLLSAPYMNNTQVVMVKEGSPIRSLNDLQGKRVAVQDGSSGQKALETAFVEKQEIYESMEIQLTRDYATARAKLERDEVDAIAVDSVITDYLGFKEPGKFAVLEETLAPENFVVGFRKGEKKFCDRVDKAIDELIEDGTFDQLSEKWFGKKVSPPQRNNKS